MQQNGESSHLFTVFSRSIVLTLVNLFINLTLKHSALWSPNPIFNFILVFYETDSCRLLFLPLASMAQDCTVKSQKDKFSQLPKLTTGFMDLSGVSLTIDADSKEIDFFFSLNSGESDCFDDNSTAIIFYEGGKLKATFKNAGSMNCQGLFHVIFKNVPSTPSPLVRLTTKKVISIKFTSTSKKGNIIGANPRTTGYVHEGGKLPGNRSKDSYQKIIRVFAEIIMIEL